MYDRTLPHLSLSTWNNTQEICHLWSLFSIGFAKLWLFLEETTFKCQLLLIDSHLWWAAREIWNNQTPFVPYQSLISLWNHSRIHICTFCIVIFTTIHLHTNKNLLSKRIQTPKTFLQKKNILFHSNCALSRIYSHVWQFDQMFWLKFGNILNNLDVIINTKF